MSILNIIVLVLFVIFLIFIFGGYHNMKSKQRDKDNKDKH